MKLKTSLMFVTLLMWSTVVRAQLVVSGPNRDPLRVALVDSATAVPVSTSANGLKVDASGSVGVVGSVDANMRDGSGNLITSVDSALHASLKGQQKVSIVRNVYSTANVTSATYTQLIASTSDVVNKVMVFDSSGNTMVLAVGAAASEVDQIYIPPGGDNFILKIPSGSRVSLKAVNADSTAGEFTASFLK